MYNFDFYNPTRIIFGRDRLGELDSHVPAGAKVLILYGGGSVKKHGTLQKVKDALGNRTVLEFGGIEPNPQFTTLMKAVELARKENVEFLLAVGGGSVMDGTKFVALASKYKGDKPQDLLFHGFNPVPVTEALPLGTVVTLPATGSEMNQGGVISYEHGKYPVFSPLSFPKFSFLDPTLTFTLPAIQVANGIIDTFVHVIEQYVTFPVDGRFQDRTAEGILQTLIEIGRRTIDNPTDYDARANLVWCATMGLNGLIGAGVPQDWTAHMIGHELTAMFGIDHGQTLAIMVPAIWKVRKGEKRQKLLQYARRVLRIDEADDEMTVDLAISRTREFFESLGVKTRLSEHGVGEDKIGALVAELEKKGLTALSETKDITPEISRTILKEAL